MSLIYENFTRTALAVVAAHFPSKAARILDMKLCKNCVHLMDNGGCGHESALNPVSGNSQMLAERNRYEGPCGLEGRFWMPADGQNYPGAPRS